MGRGLENLILHISLKTGDQGDGNDQSHHSDGDAQYGNKSDDRYECLLSLGSQVPSGNEQFIIHCL